MENVSEGHMRRVTRSAKSASTCKVELDEKPQHEESYDDEPDALHQRRRGRRHSTRNVGHLNVGHERFVSLAACPVVMPPCTILPGKVPTIIKPRDQEPFWLQGWCVISPDSGHD